MKLKPASLSLKHFLWLRRKDFNADCLADKPPSISPAFHQMIQKNIVFTCIFQVEASCHELTRLSGLLRQHSRKRKSDQNPEESGPEWKRRIPNGEEKHGGVEEEEDHDDDDDDGDFREGGEPAPMETMARINVRQRQSTRQHSFCNIKTSKID